MAIRATSDPRYYLRFLIMGLGALGFSLWSLYDGYIAYPAQRERGLAFQQLEKEGREAEWPEFAGERGWPIEAPGEPKSEADIFLQYVMVAVTALIGIPLVVSAWRARSQWIEMDESGLNSSWGQKVDFNSIVSLDKKKWKNKGIAYVHYLDGDRRRRFLLDDFKFMRQPTDDILYDLESIIGEEKIVNGPPEPLREDPSDNPPAEEAHENV